MMNDGKLKKVHYKVSQKVYGWMDQRFKKYGDKFDFINEVKWLIRKGYLQCAYWDHETDEVLKLLRYCVSRIRDEKIRGERNELVEDMGEAGVRRMCRKLYEGPMDPGHHIS